MGCQSQSLVPLVGCLLTLAGVLGTRGQGLLWAPVVDDVLLDARAVGVCRRAALVADRPPRNGLCLLGFALRRLANPLQLLVAFTHRCLLGRGAGGLPDQGAKSARRHRATGCGFIESQSDGARPSDRPRTAAHM